MFGKITGWPTIQSSDVLDCPTYSRRLTKSNLISSKGDILVTAIGRGLCAPVSANLANRSTWPSSTRIQNSIAKQWNWAPAAASKRGLVNPLEVEQISPEGCQPEAPASRSRPGEEFMRRVLCAALMALPVAPAGAYEVSGVKVTNVGKGVQLGAHSTIVNTGCYT